ncbi:response regulator [Lacinutrix salivirga]
MAEFLKILTIDDHPMIIEGYKNTIMATKKETLTLKIDMAHNCDEAIRLIRKSLAIKNPYNILFVDISIPPSSDGKIADGQDLAQIAREISNQSKIIILTMFNEPYRIQSIIQNIDPEGFLIKSDLTSRELASAFQAVLKNPPFYSTTVTNYIKQEYTNKIKLDATDRKILQLLSEGVRTKNLHLHIKLSTSAIEKRKKNLRKTFALDNIDDETLINEARKKGFIL